MNKQNNKQKAFTLAETLIALTIIGVIAAITVPALIQNTQKQEYVSALQKTYSTLSQVTNQIIAENGSPKADENGESWMTSTESLYNMYKKYLSNIKDCSTAQGCFAQNTKNGNYKNLNGGRDLTNYDKWQIRKLILADGVQAGFRFRASNCQTQEGGSKKYCADILVDINGEKGPNMHGRDLFGFVLKENGLQPKGCDYSDCTGTHGWGCACKVLRESAMNY